MVIRYRTKLSGTQL